jgi:hypothetical protein
MSDDLQTPADARSSGPSQINFASFVLSLVHTAAVHFGDIGDPVTGEQHPPNLPLAQQMIDILAMLEEKTRGNLSAEERQLIEQVLDELRIRHSEVSGGAAASESRIILP